MSRPVLLSILIYGLILTGLALLRGELLALALPFILYLGAGFLYEPEPPRLRATRHLSTDRASPGMPVTVSLSITNEGPGLEELWLQDIVPESLEVVEGQPELLASLPSQATLTMTYRISGKRGVYRFSPIQATANDFLGLFQARAVLNAPGQIFILPEIIRLRRVDIRPRSTRIYAGLIPARQGGPGVEFFGLREYQPGDPVRWLNSRATARHAQNLFVTEFEQERVADVGLILDARQQSNARSIGGSSLFEYSVRATAALAEVLLKGGNRVGLFIYGRSHDWTFPGYGKMQRERIMRALARAEIDDSQIFENLEYLPARLFPVRSQLVLVSPLLPQDTGVLTRLRARGYRLLVISPDPIAFEQKGMEQTRAVQLAARVARLERTLVLRQLRQADIRVVDWQVDRPFQQVAQAALHRFQH